MQQQADPAERRRARRRGPAISERGHGRVVQEVDDDRSPDRARQRERSRWRAPSGVAFTIEVRVERSGASSNATARTSVPSPSTAAAHVRDRAGSRAATVIDAAAARARASAHARAGTARAEDQRRSARTGRTPASVRRNRSNPGASVLCPAEPSVRRRRSCSPRRSRRGVVGQVVDHASADRGLVRHRDVRAREARARASPSSAAGELRPGATGSGT